MVRNILKLDAKVLLGCLLLILASLFSLFIPLSLKSIIDSSSAQGISGSILGVALLFISQALLSSLGYYCFAKSGETKIEEIRTSTTGHLLQVKKSFFNQTKSGELASLIVNDTTTIREFLITTLPGVVFSIIMVIGSIFVLFGLDWKLSLVLLTALPVMMLCLIPLSNLSERYTQRLQKEVSLLTGNLTETFQSYELIKTSQEEDAVHRSLSKSIQKTKTISLRSDLISSFEGPFTLVFIFATIAVIFTYGGQRVESGDLSVGTMVSFLIYLFQLINPINSLLSFFNAFGSMKGACSSLQELVQTETEDFSATGESKGNSIVFKNVDFSYDGDRVILSDINLSIPSGKRIALVGPSGSGKSTIVNLLERFYEPMNGEILVDGKNLRQLGLKEWRAKISWVSQNDAILSGSIRDNLLFGVKKDKTDEELFQALSTVLLDEEVRQMPQGLNSEVGERGSLLSGGQRQRIQIARAYLRDADYLILDEATSNLDADSEYAITQSLKQLPHDKTVIIIAHRLSTVIGADCIYFLEDAHITGSGTHQELLESHETYLRFVQEQML